ncbi:hypothetical protein BX667DRAFT_507192 [Coemansia mojavensis]|nr:hypothetical protein BX667DRAFT_507192 [Coemansia mojavensis]
MERISAADRNSLATIDSMSFQMFFSFDEVDNVDFKNIDRFASVFNELFPAISYMNVLLYGPTRDNTGLLSKHINKLFHRITGKARIVKLDHSIVTSFSVTDFIDCVDDLTYLCCQWDPPYFGTRQLIHKFKHSLQYLVVRLGQPKNIQELFESESGAPVIFSSLTDFRFTCCYTIKDEDRVKSKHSEVQFPRLRNFTSNIGYPFTDDLLFRNNHMFIETIEITLDPISLDLLSDQNIFPVHKLTTLKYAYIYSPKQFSTDWQTKHQELFKNLAKVSPSLKVSDSYVEVMTRALSDTAQYKIPNRLALVRKSSTFSETVKIMQALPNLCVLSSAIEGIGSDFSGMEIEDTAASLVKKLGVLNPSIRRWILNVDALNVAQAACCILIIASLCPNLDDLHVGRILPSYKNFLISKLNDDDQFTELKEQLGCSLNFKYIRSVKQMQFKITPHNRASIGVSAGAARLYALRLIPMHACLAPHIPTNAVSSYGCSVIATGPWDSTDVFFGRRKTAAFRLGDVSKAYAPRGCRVRDKEESVIQADL